MEKRMGSRLSALFLLLLLAISFEMQAEVAEGRTCLSQSHRFRGYCVRSSNCKQICQTERFLSGACRHTHLGNRRCFCEKPCT
uniref:Defensin 5.1 n=1 Tax=Pinus sylvestris TaxID=3349 RepID=A0A060IJX8_PINSY|nr:defensin 5.1 [Pinus sylvestris]WMM47669.1 defensin 5.1 [Pinus sylvestris]